MTDVILESVRAFVLFGLVLFLVNIGRTKFSTVSRSWNWVVGGFCLLLFGSLLDITDNFETLNRFVVIGDTEVQAFLEKFVGFLGGIVVLAIGLVRWLPEELAERTQAEKALTESEERFRALFDSSEAAIYLKDAKGCFVLVNKQFENLYGVVSKEIIGKTSFNLFSKEIAEKFLSQDQKVLANGTLVQEEMETVFKNDRVATVLVTKFPIFGSDGKVEGVGGMNIDITELKRAEEKIKASLAEKEVLLSEIHHRVNGNLQEISSMLWLQANADNNAHTVEVLQDCNRRVMLMAQLHDSRYRQDDLRVINARDFLNTLVTDTKKSMGADTAHVFFHIDVDDIPLDVDHANCYGQIISELLSNSLRHAFADGQTGNVEVFLHQMDGGVTELTVADDGTGLPEGFDPEQAESLGLKLVYARAAKLGGKIKIDGSGGTRVQITFTEQPS